MGPLRVHRGVVPDPRRGVARPLTGTGAGVHPIIDGWWERHMSVPWSLIGGRGG
ncbi:MULTISPECIES: hypothetical protein [unclassified Blastococcus]|uniref:hypothetical protein n=1 Tax=unclassified Blastococcus TaxID=2619396 RepID=UPI001EF130A3|nr:MULTISPECIES: hypothetical protein [unclassified Blastococcus]